MMREIKFRAWLTEIKKMTYTHTLEELMSWNTTRESNGTVIWMQYTGLKDKNGTEICEGDVLKSVTYRYVGEVKYVPENAAFLVFWSDDKGRHAGYLDDGMCSLIEVIGNIHDNPELLGGAE